MLAATTAFVVWQLHPSLILRNTTPTGGDLGSHVHEPAYLRDHLLPHWRLTGWSPDWFSGYPALTFYFPLPSLLIAVLGAALPYNVAFKLVVAAGPALLPLAAFAFGRLLDEDVSTAACMSAATLPLLFERSLVEGGGSIAAAVNGEFAYSLGLAVGLVALGVAGRGLRTGRHRGLTSVLIAATVLLHLLPGLFVAVGVVVLALTYLDPKRLLWLVPVGLAAFALTAFWSVPFLVRSGFTSTLGIPKTTTFSRALLLPDMVPTLAFAVGGALSGIGRRSRTAVFLALLAALSALAFMLDPAGRLWNTRLLPFWYVALSLLAGWSIAQFGRWIATTFHRPLRNIFLGAGSGLRTTPVLALAVALGLVVPPLHLTLDRRWLPTATDFTGTVVHTNLAGYESLPSWPEYGAVMRMMTTVGKTNGCGTAAWEFQGDRDPGGAGSFGTPGALMLLPYWTHGCIGSLQGLFFESSATTPAALLVNSELTSDAIRPERGLPYRPVDVPTAVRQLRLLGVRYLLASTPDTEAAAKQDPDLMPIGSVGPFGQTAGDQAGRTWDAYEIRGSALAEPLSFKPAVLHAHANWTAAAVHWFQDPSRWDIPIAASGPADWPRTAGLHDAPREAVVPAKVTSVHRTDDTIAFDVDRVGSPVVVRTSSFPNWHAHGARGPWRLAPNLLVVVPTSRHVALHWRSTGVDRLGWLLTLIGVAGLAVLAVRARHLIGD